MSRAWLLAAAGCALIACLQGAAAAQEGSTMSHDREADAREILAHIDSIFRAYLAGDRETVRRLHTEDWTGFMGPSTSIERGIDAYMINADRSLQHFKGTGYEMLDTEVRVLGDVAIVWYVARYDYRDADGRPGSIPLRSVDLYRREADGWDQFGSHIAVISSGGKWGEK